MQHLALTALQTSWRTSARWLTPEEAIMKTSHVTAQSMYLTWQYCAQRRRARARLFTNLDTNTAVLVHVYNRVEIIIVN